MTAELTDERLAELIEFNRSRKFDSDAWISERHASTEAYLRELQAYRAKRETHVWVPRDELDDFKHWVASWAEAYPLDIFPEPDLKLARKGLEAVGITLDSVSASNMRHVITRVNERAQVLAASDGNPP